MIKLSNCKLAILELTGNNIRDRGLIEIGKIVGKHYAYNSLSVSLKYLNVSQNSITLYGVEEFSKLMMLNSTLGELIIDSNKLCKSGCSLQTFKSMINQNIGIGTLSMKKIAADSLDMTLLFEGL